VHKSFGISDIKSRSFPACAHQYRITAPTRFSPCCVRVARDALFQQRYSRRN